MLRRPARVAVDGTGAGYFSWSALFLVRWPYIRKEIEQFREGAAEDAITQHTWPSHTYDGNTGRDRVAIGCV